MWRGILVLAMMALPAAAQDGANGQHQAPFEAATVTPFLQACARDMSQCDYTIRMTLLDKLPGKDATSVCLKDAHYQQSVLSWLKAHPETGKMATEDGIYAAFRALYPCP